MYTELAQSFALLLLSQSVRALVTPQFALLSKGGDISSNCISRTLLIAYSLWDTNVVNVLEVIVEPLAH